MLNTARRPVLGIASWLVFVALLCTRHSSMALPSVHERDARPDFTSITLPNGGKDLDGPTDGPFPVVFLFNGFMLRASFYKAYAQRLASWGYAVVQYDAGIFPILTTAAELTFLPQITTWAQQQEQLGLRLDLGRTAVVGHSRGGQLAALHLGEGISGLRTAFLIDPVDNTKAAPESPDYPSAAKALQRASKPVAVAGASIFGSCNPNGSNWKARLAHPHI
eukprot:jgi/Astpho2/7809/fgenesh1_pg.00117_%23_25_t